MDDFLSLILEESILEEAAEQKLKSKMKRGYAARMVPGASDQSSAGEFPNLESDSHHDDVHYENPNEEARRLAESMVGRINDKGLRQANKNERQSAQFYEIPPPSDE
uniref:Uncharacterized protein n=1 Tax=Acrobeloides nanus TaxID=290746 RepID=A0A914CVQ0_9BILA